MLGHSRFATTEDRNHMEGKVMRNDAAAATVNGMKSLNNSLNNAWTRDRQARNTFGRRRTGKYMGPPGNYPLCC